MILLIDNYDSFVYNLARYLTRLGQKTHVVRNRAIDVAGVERLNPDALVVSPGPCTPRQAGHSLEVVRHFAGRLPMLGVCLGHQVIAEAFGGRVVRAREPVHGRASPIYHDSLGVFRGLPNPLAGCRYHSLVVDRHTLPECLQISAWTEDGTIMGLRHRQLPVVGLQFHPESILTDTGYLILANFLEMAGLGRPKAIPSIRTELASS